MKLGNFEIPMRDDQYRLSCYLIENGNEIPLCIENDTHKYKKIQTQITSEISNGVFHIHLTLKANGDFSCEKLGMYLGIDTYMDKFPEWNDKLFPTVLRCEKNGFWGCFSSPEGVMLGVASPDAIVSWNHHYSSAWSDVGHRIYTASVDFINTGKLPPRHPQSPKKLSAGDVLSYDVYFQPVENRDALYSFIKNYAGITVPNFLKYTLEAGEKPVLLTKCGEDYEQKLESIDTQRSDSRIFISAPSHAETELYVRKDWFYYLDCARKSAQVCQQKPGTHTESWYGFFSRILYAKYCKDEKYIKTLEDEFNNFFFVLASRRTNLLRKKTFPNRLQNSSGMISLLTDFYEVTKNNKYLDRAADIAQWLMKLQSDDGSYRSHGTHYTCVIYPAKSMLELAIAEKSAGLTERFKAHYDSAVRAIENLYKLMDNIETEGEMTFEDGMISCEALQLAYLALLCDNEEDKNRLAHAARIILDKHRCLEQRFIPDGRTRGATMRYWEARYDINFGINMLNSPHGWTSWKTYATYYLYLLTGELEYLTDTMNTLGACMQCIDEKGVLRWAFVPNPCATGRRMVKSLNKRGYEFVDYTVSEEYLPMISDWYRHNPKKLRFQYVMHMKKERTYRIDKGGSCDNDVHEHFKCLEETVFAKAFIHFIDNGKPVLYNCNAQDGAYTSTDPFVKTYIVRAVSQGVITIDSKQYDLNTGINYINV